MPHGVTSRVSSTGLGAFLAGRGRGLRSEDIRATVTTLATGASSIAGATTAAAGGKRAWSGVSEVRTGFDGGAGGGRCAGLSYRKRAAALADDIGC